jgi:hypothetical protein
VDERLRRNLAMDWNTFWSALLGSALPSSAVSLLMLYLTHRNNKAMEDHRKEIQQDVIRFTKWHEERLKALLAIYNAFCDYLAFLRGVFYRSRREPTCMDPMHAFNDAIQRQVVYLDDGMAAKVRGYQGELLQFWNWAISSGGDDEDERRRRLDYEIPEYLRRLRVDINGFLDPNYQNLGGPKPAG